MNWYKILVSSNLANQIISHLISYPSESICGNPLIIATEEDCIKLSQDGWSSIIVNENICNSLTNDLIISNSSCLQYLYIQSNSLQNVQSFTLSNNPFLSLFIVETFSLQNASNVTISSIYLFSWLILLIFLFFKELK